MVARRWIGATLLVVGACSTDATSSSDSAGESSGDDGSPDTGRPPTDTSATAESPSEASGNGPEDEPCPDTHACTPLAPAGWLGPLAFVGDDDACPPDYPQLEIDAFTTVDAGAARCSCTCDTSTLCGALLGSDLETACSFPSPVFDTTAFAEPDVCTPIPTITGEGFHLAFEPPLAGECSPVPTVALPEPVPIDRVRVCGAPTLGGGCPADELCIARLGEAPTLAPCIARTGDHECPPEYPDVRRAFTSVLDDRACSPCACSAPDGPASCSTTARISSVDDCTDPAVPDVEVGAFTCVPTDGVVLSHLQFSPVDAFVTGCVPSGGVPVGTVEPAAPVTICCAG